MLLRSLSSLFLSSAFFLATTEAAVFERDWQAPNDGLLTYDDLNNREWLDLSQTILIQFPGSTLEENLQSVLSETSPGGIFEGFNFAIEGDVKALALSAGIDVNSADVSINQMPTASLMELLSPTAIASDQAHSVGAVDALDQLNPFTTRQVAANFSIDFSSARGRAGFALGPIGERIDSSNTGVMLYRSAIPEPKAAALLTAGIVFLAGFGKRSGTRQRNPACS